MIFFHYFILFLFCFCFVLIFFFVYIFLFILIWFENSIDSFPGEAQPDSADLNSYPKEPPSLFDEDDYFRANLPPTYDMEPHPVDVFAFDEKNISTTATKGGLDHSAEMFVFLFLFFICFFIFMTMLIFHR